ncbi:MAG: gamma-glutamyl-gamma-aminobutyrate hydrolase family protein [Synergistaceae bacterium]|jgi:putative glutamine amidotransferase|nr:gamma-glutamyl-gamma-aminobutyrate hydrolase family protein [Synergistaceae bacterium]
MGSAQDRPLVGISVSASVERAGEQYVYDNYIAAIYHAGCTPLIIPLPDIELKGSYDVLAERVVNSLDGLLLSGGCDIDARLYGEENFPFNGSFVEERDLFEIESCRSAARQKKPILGICRGEQVLNVAMGGTLFQDIGSQNAGRTMLMHVQKAPTYSCSHDVKLEPDSQIRRIVLDESGASSIEVNSFHHQAVKAVAPCLRVTAVSSDGIIEAIEPISPDGPYHPFTIGVQWHPERMWKYHQSAARLFASFAKACGRAGN